MRYVHPAVSAALAARALIARDFVWLTAKNRDTGAAETMGLWSDVGTVDTQVVDGFTGATVTRTFIGSGTIMSVSDVPLTADISVREITVELSQIDESVALAVRGYDVRAAPIQIYRGLLSPETRNLVAPAFPRFVGFVNEANIVTPPEGDVGSIALTCVSHTVELTRSNSDTRSDQSQQARFAGDRFYRDTGVVGGWEQFWGRKQGRVSSSDSKQATRDTLG